MASTRLGVLVRRVPILLAVAALFAVPFVSIALKEPAARAAPVFWWVAAGVGAVLVASFLWEALLSEDMRSVRAGLRTLPRRAVPLYEEDILGWLGGRIGDLTIHGDRAVATWSAGRAPRMVRVVALRDVTAVVALPVGAVAAQDVFRLALDRKRRLGGVMLTLRDGRRQPLPTARPDEVAALLRRLTRT